MTAHKTLTIPERDLMLCRPDAFAVWATQDLAPPLRFRLFRHIAYLSTILVEAIVSGRGRIIVNMPPQHGKSMFLSRWLVIWALEHNPYLRVMAASYSDKLVRGHSRYVRNQFMKNPRLTTRLSQDSQSADIWHTHNGHGGMMATTIGGQSSGFPYDLGLIDDPYKGWREAWSPTVRRHVRDWFDAEFYPRHQENATIVALHTRWHPEDLTSYLLNEHPDEWRLIRLPALAQEDDPLGRKPGEALCPELHTAEDLLGARGSEAVWEAVYQQNPKALGQDRIYHRFSDRNIDDSLELRDGLPLDLSFDFNVRPGMHAIIGQHWDDQDLIIAYDELHGPAWDVRRVMQAFGEWWQKHRGRERFGSVQVFGDVSGRARTVTTSDSCYDLIAASLQRLNIPYRLRVPSTPPGVLNSVDDFNEALCDLDGKVHYKLRRCCQRLLTDLRELPPDEYGHPDKSRLELSHASDAERYRVTRLRPISRRAIQPSRVNV